ncbi:serine/threonine-protein kinase HAL4/sat4 [Phlyctochytrium bullatum]|nr:serine/threonine-protein kinase HAL4/sat4 [Phlyctochytrium bullatum]
MTSLSSASATTVALEKTTLELLALCIGESPDKAFLIDIDSAATVSRLRSIISSSTHAIPSEFNVFAVRLGASLAIDDSRLKVFVAASSRTDGGVLRLDPVVVQAHLPDVLQDDGGNDGDARKGQLLNILVALEERSATVEGSSSTQAPPAYPGESNRDFRPASDVKSKFFEEPVKTESGTVSQPVGGYQPVAPLPGESIAAAAKRTEAVDGGQPQRHFLYPIADLFDSRYGMALAWAEQTFFAPGSPKQLREVDINTGQIRTHPVAQTIIHDMLALDNAKKRWCLPTRRPSASTPSTPPLESWVPPDANFPSYNGMPETELRFMSGPPPAPAPPDVVAVVNETFVKKSGNATAGAVYLLRKDSGVHSSLVFTADPNGYPWCAVLLDSTRLVDGMSSGVVMQFTRQTASSTSWTSAGGFRAHARDARAMAFARRTEVALSASNMAVQSPANDDMYMVRLTTDETELLLSHGSATLKERWQLPIAMDLYSVGQNRAGTRWIVGGGDTTSSFQPGIWARGLDSEKPRPASTASSASGSAASLAASATTSPTSSPSRSPASTPPSSRRGSDPSLAQTPSSSTEDLRHRRPSQFLHPTLGFSLGRSASRRGSAASNPTSTPQRSTNGSPAMPVGPVPPAATAAIPPPPQRRFLYRIFHAGINPDDSDVDPATSSVAARSRRTYNSGSDSGIESSDQGAGSGLASAPCSSDEAHSVGEVERAAMENAPKAFGKLWPLPRPGPAKASREHLRRRQTGEEDPARDSSSAPETAASAQESDRHPRRRRKLRRKRDRTGASLVAAGLRLPAVGRRRKGDGFDSHGADADDDADEAGDGGEESDTSTSSASESCSQSETESFFAAGGGKSGLFAAGTRVPTEGATKKKKAGLKDGTRNMVAAVASSLGFGANASKSSPSHPAVVAPEPSPPRSGQAEGVARSSLSVELPATASQPSASPTAPPPAETKPETTSVVPVAAPTILLTTSPSLPSPTADPAAPTASAAPPAAAPKPSSTVTLSGPTQTPGSVASTIAVLPVALGAAAVTHTPAPAPGPVSTLPRLRSDLAAATTGTYVNADTSGASPSSSRASSPASSLPRTASSLSLAEKYGRPERVLGKGASAVVRLCRRVEEEAEGRKVTTYAVKEFRGKRRGESQKEYVKKMMAEFCISSALVHPNVVRTWDLIKDESPNVEGLVKNKAWCVVMEYCSGGDLFTLLSTPPLPSTPLLHCYFHQLLSGVTYLHSLGVAHRDLKPENLLLDGWDGDRGGHRVLKITDFGVSEVFRNPFGGGSVLARGVKGSGPYIAPEEFGGGEFGAEGVDAWAVGIILYIMLHASLPWKSATKSDERYQYYLKHQGSFRFIDMLPPGPRGVLYKLLQPDPTRRPTATTVLETDEWVKSIHVCFDKKPEERGHDHGKLADL